MRECVDINGFPCRTLLPLLSLSLSPPPSPSISLSLCVQVATETNIDTLPSVEASSEEILPYCKQDGFYVNGANFHPKSKFYFDSSLPEELELQQTVRQYK